jgi:hypothetical protein
LDSDTLSDDDLEFAQKHLRVLSGLYGVLRPYDGIQPYRLEMGTKLANERGADLYTFWGDAITRQLNSELNLLASVGGGPKIIVNVASVEYFKSVQTGAFSSDVVIVDCVFMDNGKIVSVYAKRARGLMCRYIIQNRISDVEGIKQFNLEGYAFSAAQSTDSTLMFSRGAQSKGVRTTKMQRKKIQLNSKKTLANVKIAERKPKNEAVLTKADDSKAVESKRPRRSTASYSATSEESFSALKKQRRKQ